MNRREKYRNLNRKTFIKIDNEIIDSCNFVLSIIRNC